MQFRRVASIQTQIAMFEASMERWTVGLPLFGLLGFPVYTTIFVAPMGPQAYGPDLNIGWPPRFAFFTYMLWLVTLGCPAIKCGRQVPLDLE